MATACLNNLRILSAGVNRIIEVQPDIVRLPLLEEIYLNDNSIKHLPGKCWLQATSLTILDLGANVFSTLPTQLGQCTSITTLVRSAAICSLPLRLPRHHTKIGTHGVWGHGDAPFPFLLTQNFVIVAQGLSRNPNLAPRIQKAISTGVPSLLQYLRNISPVYELEETHVDAIAKMHEERQKRKKKLVEALVSGNSGANDGVERFYRELLALSLQGEDEEVSKAKERLAKRMLNTHQQ